MRAPAAAPPASSGRARLATGRFEAAWFARGEALEQGEADPEVTDYTAYQAHLEAIAAELEEKRRGQRSVLLFAVPEPC